MQLFFSQIQPCIESSARTQAAAAASSNYYIQEVCHKNSRVGYSKLS